MVWLSISLFYWKYVIFLISCMVHMLMINWQLLNVHACDIYIHVRLQSFFLRIVCFCRCCCGCWCSYQVFIDNLCCWLTLDYNWFFELVHWLFWQLFVMDCLTLIVGICCNLSVCVCVCFFVEFNLLSYKLGVCLSIKIFTHFFGALLFSCLLIFFYM